MKKIALLSTAFVAVIFMSFIALHTDVYTVDAKQSSLEWFAEKMTGKHNGTIKLTHGEIRNAHGNFSGSFIIDMTTIEDTDMDSPDKRKKLEGHLKSADFFDVEKFPTAKYEVTSVTPLNNVKEGGHTHNVKGMLTIKDKTNPVSFDATIKMAENKITCTGSAVVDRSKFDVKYGSKTFFKDIGDKMIYDEFTLKFNVVAAKAAGGGH